jgi:anti-anti-sigma regulatory factor
MSTTGSLRFEVLPQEGAGLGAALVGEITENSHFRELVGQLSGTVLLDLSGVKRVNSRGVREWVDFVRAVQAKGVTLTLDRCSVPIVHQLNLNAAFGGGCAVRSVFAPYFCPGCNAEHNELYQLEKRPRIVETLACPTCGAAMEFDDLPDQYLAFRDG